MCLVVLAVATHLQSPRPSVGEPGRPPTDLPVAGTSLLVLANRDEFYERPTAAADFWTDRPEVLAGRDLRSGGTWLGITRSGRIALVTNFRQGTAEEPQGRSRGLLVTDFLTGTATVEEYLERLDAEGSAYAGFNLVFGDARRLGYYSNRGGRAAAVPPGLHGLSNSLLDVGWPKVERGKQALARVLADEPDPEALLALLRDATPAPDADLPDTGVGMELERILSPIFVRTPRYGTRCSTIVRFAADGGVALVERTWPTDGSAPRDRRFELRVK